MRKNLSNRFTNFHAGHFLREVLAISGHDVAWLAVQTGRQETEIERLFAQPHMDALLFVSIGNPLGKVFYDQIHEEIFGTSSTMPAS